nr:hypothetical protein CFP56_02570 [Quercus suber]
MIPSLEIKTKEYAGDVKLQALVEADSELARNRSGTALSELGRIIGPSRSHQRQASTASPYRHVNCCRQQIPPAFPPRSAHVWIDQDFVKANGNAAGGKSVSVTWRYRATAVIRKLGRGQVGLPDVDAVICRHEASIPVVDKSGTVHTIRLCDSMHPRRGGTFESCQRSTMDTKGGMIGADHLVSGYCLQWPPMTGCLCLIAREPEVFRQRQRSSLALACVVHEPRYAFCSSSSDLRWKTHASYTVKEPSEPLHCSPSQVLRTTAEACNSSVSLLHVVNHLLEALPHENEICILLQESAQHSANASPASLIELSVSSITMRCDCYDGATFKVEVHYSIVRVPCAIAEEDTLDHLGQFYNKFWRFMVAQSAKCLSEVEADGADVELEESMAATARHAILHWRRCTASLAYAVNWLYESHIQVFVAEGKLDVTLNFSAFAISRFRLFAGDNSMAWHYWGRASGTLSGYFVLVVPELPIQVSSAVSIARSGYAPLSPCGATVDT